MPHPKTESSWPGQYLATGPTHNGGPERNSRSSGLANQRLVTQRLHHDRTIVRKVIARKIERLTIPREGGTVVAHVLGWGRQAFRARRAEVTVLAVALHAHQVRPSARGAVYPEQPESSRDGLGISDCRPPRHRSELTKWLIHTASRVHEHIIHRYVGAGGKQRQLVASDRNGISHLSNRTWVDRKWALPICTPCHHQAAQSVVAFGKCVARDVQAQGVS